jgi:hypothetical protein
VAIQVKGPQFGEFRGEGRDSVNSHVESDSSGIFAAQSYNSAILNVKGHNSVNLNVKRQVRSI